MITPEICLFGQNSLHFIQGKLTCNLVVNKSLDTGHRLTYREFGDLRSMCEEPPSLDFPLSPFR